MGSERSRLSTCPLRHWRQVHIVSYREYYSSIIDNIAPLETVKTLTVSSSWCLQNVVLSKKKIMKLKIKKIIILKELIHLHLALHQNGWGNLGVWLHFENLLVPKIFASKQIFRDWWALCPSVSKYLITITCRIWLMNFCRLYITLVIIKFKTSFVALQTVLCEFVGGTSTDTINCWHSSRIRQALVLRLIWPLYLSPETRRSVTAFSIESKAEKLLTEEPTWCLNS